MDDSSRGDAPDAAAAPPVAPSSTPARAHVNAAKRAPRASRKPRAEKPRAEKPRAEKPAKTPPAEPVPSLTSVGAPTPARLRSRRRLLIGLIAVGVVLLLGAILAIGIAVGANGDRDDQAAAPAPAATTAAPAQPSATASAAPTTAPTAAPPTVGPLPAGSYAWTALLGGECLQPFDTVWAETFTVVDCASAHTGEMVATGELTDATFPGQDALAVSVSSLCQAQGVVDVTGAEAYGDVQVSASFPVTQEQWDAGERSYYCFVDRAGGGDMLGSVDGTPSA
ncbi:hypothetical protein GTU73_00180 [Rathayibacter sp. VKM Ac-2804]|uniref:septum formation family protein n=1 Tax=Rathayibacter sp. VKM Ac-2804 TaxID=2609257 RepID=UPI00132EE436|nr:septum formation family protein [Rathayibacter sp. VKM Ac-2804]QHF22575.1 hypothetical protein GTU73_00180 [Rathayibacter sp. VKM Ac-2804]